MVGPVVRSVSKVGKPVGKEICKEVGKQVGKKSTFLYKEIMPSIPSKKVRYSFVIGNALLLSFLITL